MDLPETIRYEKDGRVAVVTIDRPEAHNALTPEMVQGLKDAFENFNRDDDLWVAILTGAGDTSFCAGGDLGQTIPDATASGPSTIITDPTKRFFSDVFKPIIGAVNGYCIAGGLEILLGTDLRIAAEHAVFGLAEVRWGIVPVGGAHIRLPRQIPWAVAMEILLTGQPITAARAHDVGLVNRVVPAEEVMAEALSLADVVCRNGPLAVRTAKEIAVRALSLETRFALEYSMSLPLYASRDAQEGPAAFMEKRQPRFIGA